MMYQKPLMEILSMDRENVVRTSMPVVNQNGYTTDDTIDGTGDW